jgi:hypothetical protein
MGPADSNRLPRVRSYSGAKREGFRRRVRDYHPLWSPFPGLFRWPKPCSLPLIEESLVLQPRPDESRRFGLRPVRSPLLGPSRLLSFPRGTEMFQFPPFAPAAYGFSGWSFRDPGLNARLTAPPGLSQSSTPFVACRRQDIPHTPLVAWPRRPCPRQSGNRIGRCYRPAPQGAGVTILLSIRAHAENRKKPSHRGTPPWLGLVILQLLPLPKLSKNNAPGLEANHPQKDLASLH